MIISIFPAVVALFGAIAYLIGAQPGPSPSPRLAQLGLVAYGAGLIALCFALAQHVVRIG